MSDHVVFLFDIDGTILTSDGAGNLAMRAACAELFAIHELPAVPVHGRTDLAIFQELFDLLNKDYQSAATEFQDCYHRHLEQSVQRANVRLLPGVERLLTEIQELDWAVPALLTGNSPRAAELKLRQVGIWEHFRFGGFGNNETQRNAVAGNARRIAEQEFAMAQRLRFVTLGDTIHDVACARSINSFAIAVTTGGSSREQLSLSNPDLLLDDLSHLSLEPFSPNHWKWSESQA